MFLRSPPPFPDRGIFNMCRPIAHIRPRFIVSAEGPDRHPETEDTLAKEGTSKEQEDRPTTFTKAKTIIKAEQHSKLWLLQYPRCNKSSIYHLLSRSERVTF